MKTLLLFILSSSFCISQNCKIIKNTVDPFTNNTILETAINVLSYGSNQAQVVRIQAIKINNQPYLRCYFVLTSPFSVDNSNSFMLLDNTNNVLKLNFKGYKTADYNLQMYNTSWYIINDFKLSKMQFEALQSKQFTKLRLHTSTGYIDHNIKPKRAKNLKKILQCII